MDDAEVFVDRDFRFATVVDRCGTGGPIQLADGRSLPGEFKCDQQVFKIEPRFTLRGPQVLFAFRLQKAYVHDVNGNFVNRLGIESAPQDLINQLGPDCLDCSPIEVDREAVEHWDTAAVDPDRQVAKRIRRVKVPMSELRQVEDGGGRMTAEKG